jgi:XapX domain-containing protein
MTTSLLALGTGFLVGLLFSWLRLPIPAPAALPGILGAVGCYVGSVVVNYFRH